MSLSEEDTLNYEDLEFITFPPQVQNAIDQVSCFLLFLVTNNQDGRLHWLNLIPGSS